MNQQQNPIRVLLVDDETALLRSLSRVLCEHEMNVETASCAAEAAAFLKNYQFDVVVCDQNMPGKSGLEFLSDIAKKKPDLITMMLSGQITGVSIAEDWASEIGVREVFAKPFDGNVIASKIKSAVNQQNADCS